MGCRAGAERHQSERAERGREGERARAPLELIRLQVEHTHHILKGIAVRLVEDKEDARLCVGRHERASKQVCQSRVSESVVFEKGEGRAGGGWVVCLQAGGRGALTWYVDTIRSCFFALPFGEKEPSTVAEPNEWTHRKRLWEVRPS